MPREGNRYLVVYHNSELCGGDGMLCRFDTFAPSAQSAVDTLRHMYGDAVATIQEVYLLTDMAGEWR